MDQFYSPHDLLIFRVHRIRVEGPTNPRKLVFDLEVTNRTTESLVVLGSSIEVTLNNINVGEGDFFHSHHALARGFVIGPSHEGSGHIDVPLSRETISYVEDARTGDVEYRIHGTVVVATLNLGPPETLGKPRESPVSRRLGDDIKNVIPRSEWVRYLAQMGWDETILFELRARTTALYPGVTKRWEEAVDQFRNHRWEDTLYACRKVFEAFAAIKTPDTEKKPNPLLLREFFEANDKGKHLDGSLRNFNEFLHLGRHEQLSTKGIQISREDALLALTITGGYFRYMSQ
jgi:hypothetical protein